MACNHRPVPHRDSAGLGLVPVASILMQIAAAHARRLHFDHDIVGLGAGIGELHQLQLAVAVKHHPTHRFLPEFSLFRPILNGKCGFAKGEPLSLPARPMIRASLGKTRGFTGAYFVTWLTTRQERFS
jgi:hypothetical protein